MKFSCMKFKGLIFSILGLSLFCSIRTFILLRNWKGKKDTNLPKPPIINLNANLFTSSNLTDMTDNSNAYDGDITDSSPNETFLTFEILSWNLGNAMFTYASAYGLAKTNNKTLFAKYNNLTINSIFKTTLVYKNTSGIKLKHSWSRPCCRFTKRLQNLPRDKNVSVGGYLSSFEYFKNFEDEIRKEFIFQTHIQEKCKGSIKSILKKQNNILERCLLIGAHMRRGDFTDVENLKFGHRPATKDYLLKAINHFRKKFEGKCLIFIILGNDHRWNLENSPKSDDVIVLQPQTAGVDLCILSSCDHSIVSAGSFGWWSAWLANGYTVYDRYQARPGSTLETEFDVNYTGYIPPHWVPL